MEQKGKFALFALTELAWGALYAAFLQFTRPGRYLARRRAWLAVVFGIAGAEGLALQVLTPEAVAKSLLAFALSCVGIVVRSLANEQALERTLGDAEN